MADTRKQIEPADGQPEPKSDAAADAPSIPQSASVEPGDGAPAPASASAAAADTAGADAEPVEPSTVPKEPLPGGPQAWRRDDDLLRAQTDPYVGGHWSVPWSDLMMVMFVLFAVLVAVQMRENRELVESAELEEPVPLSVPEPTPTPIPVPSFEPLMRVNVFERSQDAVRDARVENVEIVLLSDQSVKVSVQGPMFFELGEATLRPEVREFLDRLARVIGQTSFAVRVIGHTDDYPVDTEVFPSNWELSTARAARVARYLINSADIDPRRFTVMGRGEYEPAVPNIDDANRALNRRVEIIITRDEVEPASSAEAELQGGKRPIMDLSDAEASMAEQSVDGVADDDSGQLPSRAEAVDAAAGAPVSNAEVPDSERLEAEATVNETSGVEVFVGETTEQPKPGVPIPIRGLSRPPGPAAEAASGSPPEAIRSSAESNTERPNAGVPSTETRP